MKADHHQTKDHDLEGVPSRSELGSCRMWRPLRLARLATAASSGHEANEEDLEKEWVAFCAAHGVEPATSLPVPSAYAGCEPIALKQAVARDLRIARWKRAAFGSHAKEHFDKRKPELDRVVYSLIRVRDAGLARELWFRLSEAEATFADLAPRYSDGHEVYTAGLVGPSAFGSMHPALAAHLRSGEEGKLLQPLQIGGVFVIARVEKFLPAQLDDAMAAAMIEELSAMWLAERLDESSSS